MLFILLLISYGSRRVVGSLLCRPVNTACFPWCGVCRGHEEEPPSPPFTCTVTRSTKSLMVAHSICAPLFRAVSSAVVSALPYATHERTLQFRGGCRSSGCHSARIVRGSESLAYNSHLTLFATGSAFFATGSACAPRLLLKIADFQRFYLSVRGTFTTRSRRCTTLFATGSACTPRLLLKTADFQRFYLSVRGTFTTRSRRCTTRNERSTTRSKGGNPLQ